MPETYLHGIRGTVIDDGARPVRVLRSSAIGIVGTAPDADPLKFPLNTPVLIAGNAREAAMLGTTGTLPKALERIFLYGGSAVAVIRVAQGVDIAATTTNVIGGVDAGTSEYTGLKALLSAKSKIDLWPRIIIAPGFSQITAVANAMISVANSLRAFVYLDGPNTTDAAAHTYRQTFDSRRAMLIDPWIVVRQSDGSNAAYPASPDVAGLRALKDRERGFHWVTSNSPMLIDGISRAVDFQRDDENCRANLLNENEISTIVRDDGWRFWGDRTLASDPLFAFESVSRTTDLILDSLSAAHLWAVDRNLTKTYFDDVRESVQGFLDYLTAQGVILGGKCWVDRELNTNLQLQQGKAYFDFDFTAPAPAEQITFRAHLVNDYYDTIFA
jgi:phage tail sheath protein FI